MNDVILRTTARVATPVIVLYALYLLMRGHHEPGGGFIAGLVTVAALVLRRMASHPQRPHPQRPQGALRSHSRGARPGRMGFPALAGLGLLVAAGTGLGAVAFGRPFLTSALAEVDLPLFGHVELASAVVFDIGVFMVVVGAAMTILDGIGRTGDQERA